MADKEQDKPKKFIEFKIAKTPTTRASQACTNCRDRKVRCDALRQGMPCTNCRLDHTQCKLAGARKQRARTQPPRPSQAAKPPPIPPAKRLMGRFAAYKPATERPPPHVPRQFPVRLRFLKPIPRRLNDEDVRYLQIKGAMSVPERSSLRVFIRAYVDHVHPYMPILDLQALLSSICENRAESRVSVFLMQAILFASVSFVPEGFLTTAGYKDRESARKTLFQRAKLLYDLDVEDDMLVIVQGLLLLTLWHGTPDEPTGCWDWAGLSVTWAQRLGLHNDQNSDLLLMPPADRGLRRRVWWAVYIRDRLTALWMRRPARIEDESSNVPPLALDDFDKPIDSKPILCFMEDSAHLSNASSQKELAVAFLDLSTLCVHIGHFLKASFTTPNLSILENTYILQTCSDNVRKCKSDLYTWFRERQLRYDGLFESGTNVIVKTLTSLIRMVYSATQINLFLFERFNLPFMEPITPEVSKEACVVTDTMFQLSGNNLIRYLPMTAINVVMPAIAVHILEMASPDPILRPQGYRRLQQCLNALGEVSTTYAVAGLPQILYEASALGSTAILPFQALERGRESQASFYSINLQRQILMGACRSFDDIPLELPTLSGGQEDQSYADFVNLGQLAN
ncbi:fungal-specific transcription factor domain-containing protein [Aspergillus heterothallicus]